MTLSVSVKKSLRDFVLEVELEVGSTDILALIGENGCGKTTVLNLIAGLMRPDAGRIVLDGVALYDRGIDVPPEKRNIGYLFQSYALFPHMSVYDNVAFGLRMRGRASVDMDARVKRLLENLDLWGLRGEKSTRLSGGQKQRVALCRALAPEPAAFLLDEPLSALDAEAHAAMQQDLKPFIKAAGVPAIIVTHSVREARALADRVCVMEKGRVRAIGDPDSVLKKGTCRFVDAMLDIE